MAERPTALPPVLLQQRSETVIDQRAMLARAQYCAEMAEKTIHPDMREHWSHASDVWFYAARVTNKTTRVIDKWEWIKSSEVAHRKPTD